MGLQSQFQVAAEKLQTTQKEYSKVMSDRQTLDSQLSENKQVKEELDLAPEDGKIFKLIGPALVPQELSEARSNVEKRINYIAGELKRKEDLMAGWTRGRMRPGRKCRKCRCRCRSSSKHLPKPW